MKRALIVKLGAIGDVIMAIPAVAQLRQQGFAIDWVCGVAVADLLRSYSWINVVVADDGALLHGSLLARLRALTSLWARLRGTPYQIAATLYYDRRWRLLTLPVRAERTIVFSHTDRRRRILPGRHHTAEFARILMDLPDTCHESSLTPLTPDRLPTSPLPQPRATRVALVPAGASNLLREQSLRRWPADRYAAVAATLLQRGWEVVLLGGPGDAWVREDLAPVLGHPGLIDCIGGTTLPQFVSIANSCNLVLSHDTGPLHLAAVSHTPILALFGPTDPGSFLPRRDGVRVLWGGEQLACRPCYDGRDFAPCTSNGCMQSIATELVLNTIDSILSEHASYPASLVEISR